MTNTSINQSFPVEFVVHYQQCPDCKKDFTPHTWGALVQVRQKVDHKKTFFFLEQLILKHNAHEKVLNVKEMNEGVDFFFKNKGHAMRLLDFLQSVFPIKTKPSKQLISQDDHNNTFNYKYVYSVEIPKICKEDLVVISPKLSGIMGGCSNILLCQKISSMIHFLDPVSMKTIEMNGANYFQYEGELTCVSLKLNSTEFMVFDVQRPAGKTLNSSTMSMSKQVKSTYASIGRTSDWQTFEVKTHIGDILTEGSSVLGYDLTSMNLSGEVDIPTLLENAPQIILVKKIYPEKRKKHGKRIWKLKHLEKNEEDLHNIHKNAAEKKEKDYEEFLDELEEDPELRSHVNLYRDEKVIKEAQEKKMDEDGDDKSNNAKGKKKVRVKGAKKSEANEEAKDKDKIEEKPVVAVKEEKSGDNAAEIRLEELLSELTLTDKPEENQGEDDKYVEEFIAKLDKIKIEK